MAKWMRPLFFALLMIGLVAAFMQTPQFGRLYYPYNYREIIEANAAEFGVDPLLVAAVIRVESKFNREAVSSRGALGLMQVMPATARWIAPQIGLPELTEAQIMDPAINIRLGTWYLANLSSEFDGRLDIIIAAYNAGRGQVNQWLGEQIWSGSFADRANIPFPETRHFLFKVRASYDRYRALYATRLPQK